MYTETNISELDVLPLPHLFRSFDAMSPLEQLALKTAGGKILDVGCGAGSHSLYLQELGNEVTGIDISVGAIEVCKLRGLTKVKAIDILQLNEEKFDCPSGKKYSWALNQKNIEDKYIVYITSWQKLSLHKLKKLANKNGLNFEIIGAGKNYDYLAKLTVI